MRFRPANISLINRRHYLPQLLLTLSSKGQIQKQPRRFVDVDRATPYQCPGLAKRRGMGDAEPVESHCSEHSHRVVSNIQIQTRRPLPLHGSILTRNVEGAEEGAEGVSACVFHRL